MPSPARVLSIRPFTPESTDSTLKNHSVYSVMGMIGIKINLRRATPTRKNSKRIYLRVRPRALFGIDQNLFRRLSEARDSDSKKIQSVHIFELDHGRYLGLIKNIFADLMPITPREVAFLESRKAGGDESRGLQEQCSYGEGEAFCFPRFNGKEHFLTTSMPLHCRAVHRARIKSFSNDV